MKKNKIVKTLSTIGVILGYILIGFMIFFVISTRAAGGEPSLFGYQVKSVLSGSMEPGIQTGSIITIDTEGNKNNFQVDDVITFKKDKTMLVTHRIVEVIDKNGNIMYRTKGDNNDGADREPVVPQNIIGKYTGLTIPYVGYFVEFLKSKNGIMLLFMLPGALLIGYSILKVKRIISEFENENKNKSTVQ